MSRRLRDEDRADVVLDIDQDGHVTVTLDGHPWTPPSRRPGGFDLRRIHVPLILQQLVADRDTPLWVIAKTPGRVLKGIVVPEHLKEPNLPFPADPPPKPPRRLTRGGRAPGMGAS